MEIYENIRELAETVRDPQSGDTQYNSVFKSTLITKEDDMNEYVNEFTKELDSCNSIYIGHKYGGNCYILREKITTDDGEGYVFRVPGATRGMVYTDKNDTITNIVFCDRTCFEDDIGCFVGKEKEVNDIAEKYIGQKLEFK